MQDCGRLCANETVAAVVSASASVTASFVTKDDVMAHLRGVAVVEQDAPRDESRSTSCIGGPIENRPLAAAACHPRPPRVREETHRPDELSSAAVCSA